MILKSLGEENCCIISLDSFYKDLTYARDYSNKHRQEQLDNISEVSFDHPNAFDFDEAVKCIKDIREGNDITIPNYSFIENAR